jgi:hypothetical protein
VFYRWQQQPFENGTVALEQSSSKKDRRTEEKIHALELKPRKKDEELAELMEEHVAPKKVLGGVEGERGYSNSR